MKEDELDEAILKRLKNGITPEQRIKPHFPENKKGSQEGHKDSEASGDSPSGKSGENPPSIPAKS